MNAKTVRFSVCIVSFVQQPTLCHFSTFSVHFPKTFKTTSLFTTNLTFSPCVVLVVAFCYLGHPKNLLIDWLCRRLLCIMMELTVTHRTKCRVRLVVEPICQSRYTLKPSGSLQASTIPRHYASRSSADGRVAMALQILFRLLTMLLCWVIVLWIIIGSDRRPETKPGLEGKIVRFRSGRVRYRVRDKDRQSGPDRRSEATNFGTW